MAQALRLRTSVGGGGGPSPTTAAHADSPSSPPDPACLLKQAMPGAPRRRNGAGRFLLMLSVSRRGRGEAPGHRVLLPSDPVLAGPAARWVHLPRPRVLARIGAHHQGAVALEPVLLDLGVERGPRDAQELGGLGLLPVVVDEGELD